MQPPTFYLRAYYTTGLLDIFSNLCYNGNIKGKHSLKIPTNERVKTMNAILNKAAMTARLYDDYQYEYEFSFSFDWQDESYRVLRTNTGTCSVFPPRERR